METIILNKIKEQFQIKEIDLKEYAKIDKSMMHFQTTAYDIEGVGRVSIMNMRGMGGLMKMKTLIITPKFKNMPLLSFDLISVLSNTTLLLELYDTTLEQVDLSNMDQVKNKYSFLKEEPSNPNWYDSLKLSPTLKKKVRGKKEKQVLLDLTSEWVESYLSYLISSKDCDSIQKNKKNKEYVDGLLTNGGPSTNQFMKMIGKEKTEEFFHTYLFGTEI